MTKPKDDKPNEGPRRGSDVIPPNETENANPPSQPTVGANISGDNPDTKEVEEQTDKASGTKDPGVNDGLVGETKVNDETANSDGDLKARVATLEQQIKTLQEGNQRHTSYATKEDVQKAVQDAAAKAVRDKGLKSADQFQRDKTFPEPGSKMMPDSAP